MSPLIVLLLSFAARGIAQKVLLINARGSFPRFSWNLELHEVDFYQNEVDISPATFMEKCHDKLPVGVISPEEFLTTCRAKLTIDDHYHLTIGASYEPELKPLVKAIRTNKADVENEDVENEDVENEDVENEAVVLTKWGSKGRVVRKIYYDPNEFKMQRPIFLSTNPLGKITKKNWINLEHREFKTGFRLYLDPSWQSKRIVENEELRKRVLDIFPLEATKSQGVNFNSVLYTIKNESHSWGSLGEKRLRFDVDQSDQLITLIKGPSSDQMYLSIRSCNEKVRCIAEDAKRYVRQVGVVDKGTATFNCLKKWVPEKKQKKTKILINLVDWVSVQVSANQLYLAATGKVTKTTQVAMRVFVVKGSQ